MSEQEHHVEPLSTELWDKSLSHIVSDMQGAPINVHKLMANNPALLKAWWGFRNHSVKGGTLSERQGELLILRVAVHMQAWYEWGSHVERALRSGISIDEINQVLICSLDGTKWNAQESKLLQAVDELMTLNKICSTTLSKLSLHFRPAQVMDIIAIGGMYVILAGMINTWGLSLDCAVQDRILGQTEYKYFKHAATVFHIDLVDAGT